MNFLVVVMPTCRNGIFSLARFATISRAALLRDISHGLRKCRGMNRSFRHRRGDFRQAAELHQRHIFDRLQAIFRQEHANPDVARSAEAGHADGLALQVGDGLNSGRDHDVKRHDIGDTAHRDEIAALKPDVGDHLAIGRGNHDFAGERGLRHGATSSGCKPVRYPNLPAWRSPRPE